MSIYSYPVHGGDTLMSGNQSQSLGQITDVAANTAWPNEVTFSAWLAANLGRLSDVLDVGELERSERNWPSAISVAIWLPKRSALGATW
jgi:hypothetical protein